MPTTAVRRPAVALVAALLLAGCGGSSGESATSGPSPLAPLTDNPSASASAPGSPSSSSSSSSSSDPAGPSVPARTASSSATASSPPAHNNPLPEGKISGNLGVVDQTSDGRRIQMSAEIDGSPGWVVVQTDRDGKPAKRIGLVHRADGVHDDIVVVPLRPRASTGRLWVTLYLDRGKQGVFEPGSADRPLQFVGKPLRRPVLLTVS